MLAREIAALFPKEWKLARQKYNRDLGDRTRLFTDAADEKVRFFTPCL